MSDELTIDTAIERIGELVRDVDKLSLNWKNELGRRVEAEAKIDAAHAAGVAAERARWEAAIEQDKVYFGSLNSANAHIRVDTLDYLLYKVRQ